MGGIWIAGLSGSGKTTIGKILSSCLCWPIFDSDDPAIKPLLGSDVTYGANIVRGFAELSSASMSICCSLGFPADDEGWMFVGVRCSLSLAISRKPSGYGFWTGVDNGNGGSILDTWDGLHRACLIVNGGLDAKENARKIVESIRSL